MVMTIAVKISTEAVGWKKNNQKKFKLERDSEPYDL